MGYGVKGLMSYGVKELRSYGVKELSQMPSCRVAKILFNSSTSLILKTLTR